MRFYVGPWQLTRDSWLRYYGPPTGARTLLDLSPNQSPGSRGLFAADRLGLDYEPVAEADLTAFAWHALTTFAAPDGMEQVGPLVPTLEGVLELHLGPLGRVRAERFVWGQHGHTNRLRDLLRLHFQQRWAVNRDHARRCLDYECLKYGLHGDLWRELVPRDLLPHVPGRLPHATSYSDNFNRADSYLNVADWSCDAIGGGVPNFEIVSNKLKQVNNTGAFYFARYDHDLSGTDHTVTLDYSTGSGVLQCGPTARVSSSDFHTCYFGSSRIDNTTFNVYKVSAGTLSTAIDTGTGNGAPPFTMSLTCNGSTITYSDGVANHSVTDPGGITTGTRGGLAALNAGSTLTLDNWTAADLASGSVGAAAGTSTVTGIAAGASAAVGAAAGTATVAGFSAADLILGFIGDSIWALTNGYGTRDIPTIVGHLLTKEGAIRSVAIVNRAVSGTSTSDWVPGVGAIYSNALAAFIAAGLANNANAYVVIMLGANDAASGNSATIYDGNLKAIVNVGANALVNQGIKVILCYPIWRGDNAGYAAFLVSYQAKIDALVNGTTIRKGDVLGYNWFLQNQGETADLIHCNAEGSESDAEMVAWATWNILYNTGGSSTGGGGLIGPSALITPGGAV